MTSVTKEFEHLRIRLEELKKATNNFSSKVIGAGGFGKVYEGEVSHSHGRSMVAIKRLSREFGQGDPEFWKEIMMLSRYKHRNLISLLGFCDEEGEKILVYEHAYNGSLDRHLSSNVLTWRRRLKISFDAARGLDYLHDHKGTQQRVLHRDVKSANILLDENWNAKLSDMGLSKLGPANQQHTVIFTNVVGTPGYCDPQYMEKYTLTKESDIYSFGVVLFELMCGKLCYNNTNRQLEVLVPMWKQSYIHKKLDQIIFKDLASPIDQASLETFSDIAFQCLQYSSEQRPTTSVLVKRLGTALKFQVLYDIKLNTVVGSPRKINYVDELSTLSEGKGLFFSMGMVVKKERKLFNHLEVHEIAAFVHNAAGHYKAINRGCSHYYLFSESVAMFANYLQRLPTYIVGQIVHIERQTAKSSLVPTTTTTSSMGSSQLNPYGLPIGCEYFLVTVAMLPDTAVY